LTETLTPECTLEPTTSPVPEPPRKSSRKPKIKEDDNFIFSNPGKTRSKVKQPIPGAETDKHTLDDNTTIATRGKKGKKGSSEVHNPSSEDQDIDKNDNQGHENDMVDIRKDNEIITNENTNEYNQSIIENLIQDASDTSYLHENG